MLNDADDEKKVGLAFFLYFMVLMEVVAWDMAAVVNSRNLSKVISDL